MKDDIQYEPHRLTEENLRFLKSYVSHCLSHGHCNEHWEREPDKEYIPLRLTPDGHNYYNLPDPKDRQGTQVFKVCIGCVRPVGQWEARRLNEFLNHSAPTFESIMDSLPEIDL